MLTLILLVSLAIYIIIILLTVELVACSFALNMWRAFELVIIIIIIILYPLCTVFICAVSDLVFRFVQCL